MSTQCALCFVLSYLGFKILSILTPTLDGLETVRVCSVGAYFIKLVTADKVSVRTVIAP